MALALVLRSSAVAEDGRHVGAARVEAGAGQGCDPRPSRRTAATPVPGYRVHRGRGVAILGRRGGRPPLDMALAPVMPVDWLRSSAVAEDGRHDRGRLPGRPGVPGVAILGRRGGRPPPAGVCQRPVQRRRCDPRPSRRTAATARALSANDYPHRVAILGRRGGRPPRPRRSGPAPQSWCCDPRPSRRTAATADAQLLGYSSPGCDPRPSRRTAATVGLAASGTRAP